MYVYNVHVQCTDIDSLHVLLFSTAPAANVSTTNSGHDKVEQSQTGELICERYCACIRNDPLHAAVPALV